jgi:hypothetical protein
MLSRADQAAVWAAYVPGQESDWGKVTAEYIDVTMRIVTELARREQAT